MKTPLSAPATERRIRPEIPSDDLLESIRLGEEELKSGTLPAYETVEEIMAALD